MERTALRRTAGVGFLIVVVFGAVAPARGESFIAVKIARPAGHPGEPPSRDPLHQSLKISDALKDRLAGVTRDGTTVIRTAKTLDQIKLELGAVADGGEIDLEEVSASQAIPAQKFIVGTSRQSVQLTVAQRQKLEPFFDVEIPVPPSDVSDARVVLTSKSSELSPAANAALADLRRALNAEFVEPVLPAMISMNFNSIRANDRCEGDEAQSMLHRPTNLPPGRTRVRVAVADNGFDEDPRLVGAMLWPSVNFVSRESDAVPSTRSGWIQHGTWIVGIIAAAPRIGDCCAGVAHGSAEILPIRVVPSVGDPNTDDIVRSIDYAASQGARIFNASWSTRTDSAAVKSAIEKREKAMLFIVSAGDSNGSMAPCSARDLDRLAWFPAKYSLPNVMTVGPSDLENGDIAYSSVGNFGAERVAILAPGGRTCSLGSAKAGAASGATAFASAAAALVWSANPTLAPQEVVSLLIKNANRDGRFRLSDCGEREYDGRATSRSVGTIDLEFLER